MAVGAEDGLALTGAGGPQSLVGAKPGHFLAGAFAVAMVVSAREVKFDSRELLEPMRHPFGLRS